MDLYPLFIELNYGFFIFYRPTRKYMLTAVACLHIGIAMIMQLYSFSTLMIVWNIAAFARLSGKEGAVYAVEN